MGEISAAVPTKVLVQGYDAVLKLLLPSAGRLLQLVTEASICNWINVELPTVQQLRVDLLGVTEAGGLEHIELQSQNDPQMPLRMLEYRVGIYRQEHRFPRQTVLYVGREKLSMPNALETEHLSFRYNLIDASELDGESLLASQDIGDNILAVLAHVRNQDDAIRSILAKIDHLDPIQRQDTIAQFLIVSGLRDLGKKVREEANKMPVTESILDHDVIGPVYRSGMQRGLEQGLEQGLERGLEQGRLEGERAVLRRQLEKRFGPLPASAVLRLEQSSTADLEEVGIRLLDAATLEELLPD